MQVLGGIYVAKLNTWLAFLASGGVDAREALQSSTESLLALRVIRRLMITAYEYPNEDTKILEFWNILRTNLDGMLPLSLNESSTSSADLQLLAEKHLIQISKLHLDMANTHPTGFAFLPESTGIARAYWNLIKQFGPSFGVQSLDLLSEHHDADVDETSILEKLVLKGLLLLRACTKMVFNPTKAYTHTTPEIRAKKEYGREIVKTELLNEAFAREVMETLVPQYFVFRLKDLRDWEEEPEQWESREEGESDSWEFSIRSCSEKLFLELFIYFKESLVPPLLGVFHNATSTSKDSRERSP